MDRDFWSIFCADGDGQAIPGLGGYGEGGEGVA